jgi:hypothetical protein
LFLDSERQLMLGRERSGECFDPETGEILDLFTPRGSFLFDRNNRLVLNTSSRLESSTPKQRRQAAKLAAGMLAGPEQSEAPGSEESCLVVGEGTTCNSSAAAARAMKRIFQSPAPITHSFY